MSGFARVHCTLESFLQAPSSFSAACEACSVDSKSKPQIIADWWVQPDRKGGFRKPLELALLAPAEVQDRAFFVYHETVRVDRDYVHGKFNLK